MSDKKNPVSTQANLSIKEKLLKNVFIAGLNSDNQSVAEKYGEDLPLEKLLFFRLKIYNNTLLENGATIAEQ
ncbi:hypothetical protein Glove_482g87 [Diversispora epigaea]|uniref:Uncharacterized protein n=1 Tax=Diversispora epigaea TaxID=1348612 RepID=A0A397GQ07_9GLOM|nr:hypothetical protein Glove_482g87 [Diversispora epigaea]